MEGDGAQLINLRASFLLVKPILWTYEVLIAKQRRTQWWSQVHYLNVDPFPSSYVKSTSCPPDIAHVISVPKPSLFFTALPLLCVILNTNWRAKWGRAGNEAIHLIITSIFIDCSLSLHEHPCTAPCLPMRMVGTFSTFVHASVHVTTDSEHPPTLCAVLVYAGIQWSAQGGKLWRSQHRGLPLCNKQIPWLFHVWFFAVQPHSQICAKCLVPLADDHRSC